MATFSVVNNIAALNAQNQLVSTQLGLGKAIGRLSSGLRINGAADVGAMASALAKTYTPSKVVLFRSDQKDADVVDIAPYTKEQTAVDGQATAYVCRDFACELPTTNIDEMLAMLGRP